LASVNYTGNSSLVVGIRVISENIKTRQVKHTNTSYFTMVALMTIEKTTKVPGLILENDREVYRFHKGLLRKK
jgi:acyl-CoA hydrolase